MSEAAIKQRSGKKNVELRKKIMTLHYAGYSALQISYAVRRSTAWIHKVINQEKNVK